MKVFILAGGLGTRLAEETEVLPKPMVNVGQDPILWHIMKSYAHYGFCEFVVGLGYRGDVIKRFFLDVAAVKGSFSLSLRDGTVVRDRHHVDDWLIHFLDTGSSTETGGRLLRASPFLSHSSFLMTYGDGVANVDIGRLVAYHRAHGRLATLTAVRPPSRFGCLEIEGQQVSRFTEKPQVGEGWINGGYFVLEPEVLDYIEGDETVWEREPLERLAREGQLMAYRHEGFWQCMDTLRDKRYLNSLWESGRAPWKVWE